MMTKKELYNHMLKMMNQLDGFTIIDKNGYYLFVNESWTKAMGYTLEQLDGIRAQDLFPDSQSMVAISTGKAILGHPVKC